MHKQATRKLPEDMGSDTASNDEEDSHLDTPMSPPTEETPVSPEITPPSVVILPSNLGNRLTQEREEKGLSIDEVANRLYLEPRIIEALEKEHYDQLPPVIFVQGYLRSYAKLLDLPPDDVLNAYYKATDQAPPQGSNESKHSKRKIIPPNTGKAQPMPQHTHKNNWWGTTTLILILLLIGLVAWRYAGHLAFPNLLNSDSSDGTESTSDMAELPLQSTPPESDISSAPSLLPQTEGRIIEYTPPTESPLPEPVVDRAEQASSTTQADTATTPATTPDPLSNPLSLDTVEPHKDSTPAVNHAANMEANGDSEPDAEMISSMAEKLADSAEPAAAAPELLIELSFTEESWVSISDSRGKKLVYGTAKAGESHRIETASLPIKVTLGRPKGVKVFNFKGKPVDLSRFKDRVARLTLK